MEIAGRAAIVTGGGTGVGRATALRLGGLGCSVLVNYSRSREAAEQTAAEVEALGVKALSVQADVGNDSECRAMVAEAEHSVWAIATVERSVICPRVRNVWCWC